MKTYKIGQIENNSFICWYTGNALTGMRDFLQYILDNCQRPESFIVIDCERGTGCSALQLATDFFKLHKRTLAEKLEG